MERMLMMQQEAETALLNSTTFTTLPAIMCHALQQRTSVTAQNAKNGVISQKKLFKRSTQNLECKLISNVAPTQSQQSTVFCERLLLQIHSH